VLLDTLSAPVTPVVIDDPARIRPDTRFLRSLVELTGGAPHGRTGLELTAEFMDRVAAVQNEGRMVSILVDDAHRLSSSQLEILRTLLSSAGPSHPVNVVLFGEPDLVDKIGRKRRLADRLTMHHTLNPLNRDDALAMLDHRLNHAGIDPATRLFTTGALEMLYTRSRGNPGSMFTLAGRALAAADAGGHRQIDTPQLQEIAGPRAGADRQIRLPFGEDALTGDTQPAGS
jgi:type II secretory pathway predicted ATPase ExeA